MISKAPLATFLASTAAPAATETHSQTPAEAAGKPTADDDMREAARAVILTILSYTRSAPDEELRKRSEIDTELYDQSLKDLLGRGFVVQDGDGFALTPSGIDAAAQQRSRILSIAS